MRLLKRYKVCVFIKTKELLDSLERDLIKSIKVNIIKTPKKFLDNNITINSNTKEVWIDQKDYTNKLLNKYGILNSWNNKAPNYISLYNKPREILGILSLKVYTNIKQTTINDIEIYQAQIRSLIYLALRIKPDIIFIINYCVRFMSNPNKDHFLAVNRIWNYLLKYLN